MNTVGQQMRASFSKADEEEREVCDYCEQLPAAFADSSSTDLVYLSHHPSILSFQESAQLCPLCRQLLHWIDADRLEECRVLENHGCRSEIQFVGLKERDLLGEEYSQEIVHWKFDISTYRRTPPKREIWTSRSKDRAGVSVQLVVAHNGWSSSVVSRPIWASAEYIRLEQRIVTVHEWLRQCLIEHGGCKAQNCVLPARILDISQSRGLEDVALISLSTVERSFKYLALSHCWGKGGVPIRTTKENHIEPEKRLETRSLSRTFQDAVRIGRLLGYNYLWIDSLCIIQDDADNWEREAAKMASIFRCADIVLCAASASNSTEGCSIDEALEPASSFPFPSALSYQSNTSAQVHDVPRTKLFIRRDDGARSSLETCPIQKRGWIFQEILLAQRVLYFVNGQMIWQCHGLLQSEDGHISKTQTPGILRIDNDRILSSAPLYDLKKQFRIGMDKHVWWHILKDFFKRVSTKPEDTLPSLAGLIDVWKEHTGDDPVLGLWRKDLPFHMCWFFGPALSIGRRVPGQPSWCWTSVPQSNRAILRHASCNIARSAEIIWQAAIRAIDIQWEGRPFVSRLKHARLSIYRVRATKGAFNQAISYLWDDKEEDSSRRAEAVEVLPLIITKPVGNDRTEGDRFHMHALLLERSHMANGHAGYRRKGYADFISSSGHVDPGIDKQVEEIIGGIEVIDVITVV